MTRNVPKLSYVICTIPRTGSSMLSMGLCETGVCGLPDEFFNNDTQLPRAMREHRLTCFSDYLDMVLNKKTGPSGVFGFKLHWDQLEFLQAELSKMESYRNLSATEALNRVFGGIRYIYLTRRDKVRQAVSFLIAFQTNKWIHLQDEPVQGQKDPAKSLPTYDRIKIDKRCQVIEKDELSWKKFFAENSIVPLELVYEDMVGAYEETLNQVIKYLGLENTGASRVCVPPTRRQSDSLTELWVQKYRRPPNMKDPIVHCLNYARAIFCEPKQLKRRDINKRSSLYRKVHGMIGARFTDPCAFIYTRVIPERVRAFVRNNFK